MRILAWLVSVAVIGGAVFYFLPREWKLKGVGLITDVVPKGIKDKTEDFLLSPPEKRDKLLGNLKDNLDKLQVNQQSSDTPKILQDSEALLQKLKDQNNELSLTELIKTKLVDQLLGNGASTTQCVSQ